MKPFSRDWAFFTAGFMWAFACGALMSVAICSWTFSMGFNEARLPKCPDPLVEMAEYRGVVHALDRCYQRLDEEQQTVLGMRGELDHWDYVERLTHTENPDDEINCQVLLNRALQDVWFDAEDDLYECWNIQREECWCPFGDGPR